MSLPRQDALGFVIAVQEELEVAEGRSFSYRDGRPTLAVVSEKEKQFWRDTFLAVMVAFEVVYEGRDPSDTRLPHTLAARLVCKIISRLELLESQYACGYGTLEEVKYWQKQYEYADKACTAVYNPDYVEENKVKPLEWVPIEEDDHVLSREEFEAAVNSGAFIDYDGYGEYAVEKKKRKSNVTVSPSDLKEMGFDTRFTHVVWYNR